MSVPSIVRSIIQCAVLPEFEGLRQIFRAQKIIHEDDKTYFVSENSHVVVLLGGMGKFKAKESAAWALKKWKTLSYFDFGIAGAVAPQVLVGDVIVVNKIIFSNLTKADLNTGQDTLKTFPEFSIQSSCRVYQGGIQEVIEVILDAEHRRQIYESSKSMDGQGAAAVTWETGTLYEFAASHKLRFHSVRMVSDASESDLLKLRTPYMLRRIRSAAEVLHSLYFT